MNHDSSLMTQISTAASDPDDPAAAMAMAMAKIRTPLLPPHDSSFNKQQEQNNKDAKEQQ
jgi:hypothetical protein